MKNACEKSKKILSANSHTSIEIDALSHDIDYATNITRNEFEQLNLEYFQMCIWHIERVLFDANINKRDVHEVILVGGSSRIPKIQQLIQLFFNGKELNKTVNADEAVVIGATIKAAILSGINSQKFANSSIRNVTSLSLGSEKLFGRMDIIFPRNSLLPISKTEKLSQLNQNQSNSIKLFEGENQTSNMNTILCELNLNMPREVTLIDVIYKINDYGILKINAFDRFSNQDIKISYNQYVGRFGDNDIQLMSNNCEYFREEDKEYHRKAEARHELETFIIKIKENLENIIIRENIHEDQDQSIRSCLLEIQSWIEGNSEATTQNYQVYKQELKEKFKKLIDQTVHTYEAEIQERLNKIENLNNLLN